VFPETTSNPTTPTCQDFGEQIAVGNGLPQLSCCNGIAGHHASETAPSTSPPQATTLYNAQGIFCVPAQAKGAHVHRACTGDD